MTRNPELEDNLRNLSLAFKLQCEGQWEDSWECLKKSWDVLNKFIVLADNQPQIQQILNQEREILPNLIIQNYESSVYDELGPRQPVIKPVKKKAKQKNWWSEEETKKLKEAVQIYGKREFRSISAFIGTRTVSQIRSKLQKIELKRG
jgi:SHAQKYF class myb-like DNA-binding protein